VLQGVLNHAGCPDLLASRVSKQKAANIIIRRLHL